MRSHLSSHARPRRIAGAKVGVEAEIVLGRVGAVFTKWTVEIERATGGKYPRGARHQSFAGRPGRDVDHVDADDRIGIRYRPFAGRGIQCMAGLRFARRATARWASMLRIALPSGLVGCQSRWGRAATQCTACSPLPAATSSTSPVGGRKRASTVRMASRLRAVAGAWSLGSEGHRRS